MVKTKTKNVRGLQASMMKKVPGTGSYNSKKVEINVSNDVCTVLYFTVLYCTQLYY